MTTRDDLVSMCNDGDCPYHNQPTANSCRCHKTREQMMESALEAKDAEIAGLKEVLDDKRRLTRELDIAMHGEEYAAKQASLCDLIEPARQMKSRISDLERQLADETERCAQVAFRAISSVLITDDGNTVLADHVAAAIRGGAK